MTEATTDTKAGAGFAGRNIALLVEYDGTPFCGWQSQDNARSIQDTLQKAIYELTGETVKLYGCSRTDAGVHASGHVSNFRSSSKITVEKFPVALNAHLPPEVSVRKATTVPDDFHARFCAVGKQYRYTIWNAPARPALYRDRAYHAPRPLRIDLMEEAAADLVGTKDFSAFMASGSEAKSTIRTLHRAEILTDPPLVHLIFYGDGFLYNMVRILAGTLYYVGIGKLEPDCIASILAGKDRTKAGKTLPACGLILEKVFYDSDIFGENTGGMPP